MKKRLLTVALAATMVLSSALPAMAASDLENGLIGYYTFDDTLENAVGEGTAKVHGGAGANWVGGPKSDTATYAEGKNGKGYSFAGDDDDAAVANDATTEIDEATLHRGDGLELDVKTGEDITISLWVNSKEKNNYQPVLFTNIDAFSYINYVTNINDFSSASIVDCKGYWNYLDAGTYMDDTKGTAQVGDLAKDTWLYITITVSKNGEAKLYHNGELVDVDTILATDGDDEGADPDSMPAGFFKDMPIFLGVNWWDRSFKGVMDDVAVYNRVLSATEVADLYAANGVIETSEPTPSETEDVTETGDMTAVFPVAILAVAAMAVVVVMRKRTVAE